MRVGGQRHAPAALPPRKRPGTHCIGGWGYPRAGLDGCWKISPPPGFDPNNNNNNNSNNNNNNNNTDKVYDNNTLINWTYWKNQKFNTHERWPKYALYLKISIQWVSVCLSVCLSILTFMTSPRFAARNWNSEIWRRVPSVSELCFGLSVIRQSGFTRPMWQIGASISWRNSRFDEADCLCCRYIAPKCN